MRLCWWLVLMVLSSLVVVGCGSSERPKYAVSQVVGMVTLDGQPLEKGRIQFAPVSPTPGAPVSAEIVAGKFEVADVPVGQHKVIFNASKETGKMISDRSQPYPEVVNLIPETYRDGVDATVAGPESKQAFDLKSK